MFESMYMIRIF